MSWIREEEDVAAPAVRTVMSINPTAMQAVGDMTRAITFGASTLTRVQEEAIATVVSVANKCQW